MAQVVIIGGGSWGLAIANLLADNKVTVSVWEYNNKYVREVELTGYNSTFLPGIRINDRVLISSDMNQVFKVDPHILIFAVPSHTMRSVAIQVRNCLKDIKKLKAIINLAKGVEEKTMKRMSEVLLDELPSVTHRLICSLSGPSHAEEVANFIPTTVTLAGDDDDSLVYAQSLLSNEYFRVYTSEDLIGVELGGAVKNIIAIAAGIIDGIGLGDNTMGALLTRGLAEIRRLGVKLNAHPQTFNGLSGIGDLITTAISRHSRNRYVGYCLGKGQKLDDILSSMAMVAEGVRTTRSIYHLSKNLQVDMPITCEVYNILFNNKDPQEAIRELMTRDLKEED